MALGAAACGEHDKIVSVLTQKYGEVRQVTGLLGNEGFAIFELFRNVKTGTWTALAITPGGPTCIMAAGQDMVDVPIEKPGQGL